MCQRKLLCYGRALYLIHVWIKFLIFFPALERLRLALRIFFLLIYLQTIMSGSLCTVRDSNQYIMVDGYSSLVSFLFLYAYLYGSLPFRLFICFVIPACLFLSSCISLSFLYFLRYLLTFIFCHAFLVCLFVSFCWQIPILFWLLLFSHAHSISNLPPHLHFQF